MCRVECAGWSVQGRVCRVECAKWSMCREVVRNELGSERSRDLKSEPSEDSVRSFKQNKNEIACLIISYQFYLQAEKLPLTM